MNSAASPWGKRLLSVLLALAVLALAPHARAQVVIQPDTARNAKADSLHTAADSTAAQDSLRTAASPSGIDSVVTYTAVDSILYALSTKTMHLYGKGDIKYKELGLKAERININWNTSILTAQGVPDTADTTGKKLRGIPDLIDGGETYHGTTVAYNFRTRKGKIDLGKTEIEQGYYYGDEIKKMNENVLFVEDGKYTTCNLEHPHYYFSSPEMKIVLGERVVARPVVLEIADVPVFALPFGIFPTQRGRRSGLIAPTYGESVRGRYLSHLGYYWAISDYMDWSARATGYSKGGYTLYSDFRYGLRYNFNGAISGSYGKVISGERGDPGYTNQKDFRVSFNHDQQFDPTTRLFVDFTFMSGSYFQSTSVNMNDLLTQNILSNATLTKSWEGTPNSISINAHRDQNLRPRPGEVEIGEILPSVAFSRGQSFPFRSGKRGATSSSSAWYELIGYTYGGQLLNTRNSFLLDTLGNHRIEERRGIQHQVSVNASPRLGYFTITPFFNYTEKWYDRSIDRGLNQADSVVTNVNKGFHSVRYFDVGLSASTKFYGIFQPNVFGIKGIRHQVTPSLSYSYQPDFSRPRYGYFGSYRDTSGNVIRYNHYEQEVFGGSPAGERQAISFNIGNVFEMKTASNDSSGQDNKFQLLNLGLGVSYNFAADSLKFSEVGVDFRTAIGQYFSIGGSSRFNLYEFVPDPQNPVTGRRVNKFLWKEQGRIAELTAFSISVGTHLSGEKKQTTAGPTRTPEDSLARAAKRGYVGLYDQDAPDFSIPWNLDLTWNFNQSQPDPRYKYKSTTLSASLGFNLTEFWKITATSSYDILNKVFAAPQVTVYRDLHCWELNFTWVPTGQWRNYRVEIRLKAPQLQDVKLTKQASARGVYY